MLPWTVAGVGVELAAIPAPTPEAPVEPVEPVPVGTDLAWLAAVKISGGTVLDALLAFWEARNSLGGALVVEPEELGGTLVRGDSDEPCWRSAGIVLVPEDWA